MLRRTPFWTGITVAIMMHLATGWWLNATGRMWHTLIVVWVVSVIVSFAGSGPLWRPGCELWVGFVFGSATVLLATGPGTMFPVAIASGAAMAAVAVAAGWGVGAMLRRKLRDPNAAF